MTSQKDQIQTLIAEIDGVLQRANPRLPWVMSGEAAQQRQVLERVRNYLVSLQHQPPIAPGVGVASGTNILSEDLYYQPSQDPTRSPAFENATVSNATTQQLLERVLQEISQLRVSLTPPNQHPASAELIQILMNRLQEHLTQQIAQALNPTGGPSLSPRSDYMLATGMPPSALSTSQYEQLQALRRRSDQMLVNLDATLNIVFESLQRNIQTYQDSLSQGLERMYSLGQQSEITFKALVEVLAQQLQQEVSASLPSATEALQSHPTPSPVEADAATQAAEPSGASDSASEVLSAPAVHQHTPPPPPSVVASFPYAGTEILSTELSQADLTSPANPPTGQLSLQADPATNAAIAAWLDFAKTQDQQAQAATPVQESSLPDLDLSDLELGAATSTSPSSPVSQVAENQSPVAARDEEDSTEIDAALKLLENLSAELGTASPSMAVEDAEAQLDVMLGSTSITGEGITLPEIPNDARDELDEFYQSLFGESEAESAPETLPDAPESTSPTIAPTAAPTATEELFLENLFEEAPTLPPIQLPESLLAGLSDGEAFSTQPDLVIPPPPAIDPESVTFSSSEQITSLTDLFSTVNTEQERSTPVEPPIAPSSDSSSSSFPSIEIPFEQTYSELSKSGPTAPPEPLSPQNQEFGFDTDDLSEDQYTRAAFDENLLPDAPTDTASFNLELDEMTLSSLNEDLANLENFGYEFGVDFNPEPAIARSDELSPPSSPTFTLDDFAAALTPADQSSASLSSEISEPSLDDFAAAISSEVSELSLDDFAAAISEPPSQNSNSQGQASEDVNGLFNQFSSAPSLPTEVVAEDYTTPFTLEGMDDLFDNAPSIDSSATSHQPPPRNIPIKEIPPFKPASFAQVPEAENLPPFKLERLDSLFIEFDSSSVAESTPPDVAPPGSPDLDLDEAFESLMGPLASPYITEGKSPPSQPESEKKKS